jgi:alanine dehydrogenase
MRIGVPKEIKDQEYRIALTPGAVGELVARGHQVTIERGAGLGAGFTDQDFIDRGARIVDHPAQVFEQELVLKVKEPLPQEYQFLHDRLILFTYLHLAADRDLTLALLRSGCSALAYETVQLPNGQLPLLTPMSLIAGRLAAQFGSHFLTRQQGGRGILLGGIPGVRPGRVVILGGGTVGTEAAKIAVGLGARVQIFDINLDRLNELAQLFGSRVELLYSNPTTLAEVIPTADLVIGAVLVPGQKSPRPGFQGISPTNATPIGDCGCGSGSGGVYCHCPTYYPQSAHLHGRGGFTLRRTQYARCRSLDCNSGSS